MIIPPAMSSWIMPSCTLFSLMQEALQWGVPLRKINPVMLHLVQPPVLAKDRRCQMKVRMWVQYPWSWMERSWESFTLQHAGYQCDICDWQSHLCKPCVLLNAIVCDVIQEKIQVSAVQVKCYWANIQKQKWTLSPMLPNQWTQVKKKAGRFFYEVTIIFPALAF